MSSVSPKLCPLGPPEHPCMNSTLQHVFNMWASGVCVCVCVFYVCVWLFAALSHTNTLQAVCCMIWHILSPEHFPVHLLTILVYVYVCGICYTCVYVECLCECVCVN